MATVVSVKNAHRYIGKRVLVPSTGEYEILGRVDRERGRMALSGEKWPDVYTLTFETRWDSKLEDETITVA